MQEKYILGNAIIGIRKEKSEESKTTTYSLIIFPLMFDISIGNGWNYNEVSIGIIPLFRISINAPLID
tara:strand:- start:262 stop:465 length:204 start_codon:yes stop_codon:yes gene_type:complete